MTAPLDHGAKAMTPDDPEFRATVLAEVLRAVMLVPGSATATAIFQTAMEAIGRPEEECSAEIYAAIGLLVRRGLVTSNTAGPTHCTISAETMLTASPSLLGFTWADSLCGSYPA